MAEPYLRDAAAIYERSFAIIRAEADLSGFSAEEAEVAIRMIHACGLVDAAKYFLFGHGVVAAARAALARGAPILCDAEMVAHGITRRGCRHAMKCFARCAIRAYRRARKIRHDALRSRLGVVGRQACRRCGRNRQRPDGIVPAS